MRKLVFVFCAMLLVALASSTASSATITIFDWGLFLDGGSNLLTAPPLSGLSNFSLTFGPGSAGTHVVIGYVDIEIDEPGNTFFNENGSTFGVAAAGQSWEIDEPGFVGPLAIPPYGDIYAHLLGSNAVAGSLLDNMILNGLFAGNGPEDIAMAIGWVFVLTSTEQAGITFTLSEIAPTGGFYLVHNDPDSPASVYFSSGLNIVDTGENVIPEPGTVILLLSGLGLVAAARFRKSA